MNIYSNGVRMELITQHMCLEKDVGIHGNLFGGIMMAWLDESAAILACQYARSNRMVTVLVNETRFIQPVKVGDIAQIKGKIEHIGKTSVTVKLVVNSIDPENQAERNVCETSMVFVNIDKWGNKAPIKKYVESNE
jgi:acyl-CoA thioesterase YciA